MLRKPTLYSSSAHSRTAQESAEARAARVPSSAPDGGNYDEDDEDSNGYDNADPNKERVGHGPWKKVIPAEEVMQIPVPVEVEKPSSKTYVSPALRYSVSLKIPSIQNQSNPNPSAAAGQQPQIACTYASLGIHTLSQILRAGSAKLSNPKP